MIRWIFFAVQLQQGSRLGSRNAPLFWSHSMLLNLFRLQGYDGVEFVVFKTCFDSVIVKSELT